VRPTDMHLIIISGLVGILRWLPKTGLRHGTDRADSTYLGTLRRMTIKWASGKWSAVEMVVGQMAFLTIKWLLLTLKWLLFIGVSLMRK